VDFLLGIRLQLGKFCRDEVDKPHVNLLCGNKKKKLNTICSIMVHMPRKFGWKWTNSSVVREDGMGNL